MESIKDVCTTNVVGAGRLYTDVTIPWSLLWLAGSLLRHGSNLVLDVPAVIKKIKTYSLSGESILAMENFDHGDRADNFFLNV